MLDAHAPREHFAGRLYDADTPEGGAECTLALRGDALVARLPEGREVVLPLASLVHERQGFDGDVYAFHPRDASLPWLSTRERALVEALRRHPGGARVLGDARGAERRGALRTTLVPLAVLVLLALLLATGVWLAAGPLLDAALRAIPTSVDAQLGRTALPYALEQLGGEEVHDPEVVEPLRRTVERLAAQLPAEQRGGQGAGPGHAFTVHVVEHEMVNAFALPGGVLVVTTGLLGRGGDPDAVAGVLAHEVTHVTARHSLRALLGQAGTWVLLAAVFGDASGASALLVQQAASLTHLSFSRRMELEADRGGVALLRGAGMDPRGLRRFLESLGEEEERAGGDALPELLRTHPVTDERLRALDALDGTSALPGH